MDGGDAGRKAEMPEDSRKVAGGTRENRERERQASTAVKEKTSPEALMLMEEVLRRENMERALRRVRSNKGAPGVDGMTVDELTFYLKGNWARITPLLRGWVNYFRLSDVKTAFEELDGWIRRKLRCLEWQQWKRPQTRAKKLIERGIDKVRAFTSAYNGRGAWWNAGASHMNAAFPSKWFAQQGLVSLFTEYQRFLRLSRTAVCRTARTVV